MPSSGTLCYVALLKSYVSEERIAAIVRVTRIGELGTLAVGSNRSTPRRYTDRQTISHMREWNSVHYYSAPCGVVVRIPG
jgi:hypothetical protein